VTIGLEMAPGSCSQTYISTYISKLAKHNLSSLFLREVIYFNINYLFTLKLNQSNNGD